MLHNDPFVFSDGTTNSVLTGAGTIQLTTHGAGGNATIFTMAVGFLNAQDFIIEDVNVRGSSSFNIAIYGSNDGVLRDTDIIGTVVNTDGISIVNSQNVLVTGNVLDVDDDGMYAVTRIIDPRDYDPTSWWTRRIHQPTQFIEFANNTVNALQGFALRGTINGVTDLREVETTDIYVHDNYLRGRVIDAVGCWSTTQTSPMTRYTFENNTYVDDDGVNDTFANCTLTDFNNDFGFRSNATMINGDFENTGDAWWSPLGDAGSVTTGSTDPGRRGTHRVVGLHRLRRLHPELRLGPCRARAGSRSRRAAGTGGADDAERIERDVHA